MTDELTPNRMGKILRAQEGEESLHPKPNALLEDPIRLDVLRELEGKSIISANQFTRDQVIELCKLAAVLETVEIATSHPLDGKLIITAFFEASTRTRTSFESAVLRLDGKIISIPDGGVTGIAKGESLHDIGEMFNAYGDLLIMRNRRTEAVEEISQRLRIPLINAGNGSGEHPTQALADWYALLKWNPQFLQEKPKFGQDTITLGVLGTPGSMRAVKSFVLMSLLFKEHIQEVRVISEMSEPYGEELKHILESNGVEHSTCHKLSATLYFLDVIYMNSITLVGDSYHNMGEDFRLTSDSELKKGAVILHPLARLDELDRSLDETPHNLYFSQAHGAVFVRQALLMAILGRLDRLPPEIKTVG
jgi:aspartate carbamoyltransferase catalytic subunit